MSEFSKTTKRALPGEGHSMEMEYLQVQSPHLDPETMQVAYLNLMYTPDYPVWGRIPSEEVSL